MKPFDAAVFDDWRGVATWLGYAGLIPFVVGCGLIVVGHGALRQIAIEGLLHYAAIIVSFMAAIHWGRAMFDAAAANQRLLLLFSVIAALLGWLCLFSDSTTAMFCLAMIFAGLYGFDRLTLMGQPASTWYLTLRLRLTAVVIVTLVVSALAL